MHIRLMRDLDAKCRAAGSMTVDAFFARVPEVPTVLRDEPLIAEFVRAFGPQLAVAQRSTAS